MTYTDELLASPPPGVHYTTHDQAMADGRLVEMGTRATVRAGSAPRRAQAAAFAVWRKAEGVVRSSGLAYRERLRHFHVQPGAFDLIHVHVFHTRFVGLHPPIVFSAAGPLEWLYADHRQWSHQRLRLAEGVDRGIGAVWGATMCGGAPGQASRIIAFSQDFRRWLITNRRVGPHLVDVVPNYISIDGQPRPVPERVTRLGFVARDFEAKGGRLLLQVFARLRVDRPDLTLTVIGSSPDPVVPEGVTWVPFVPRERMLAEVLPSIEVFIYPTRADASTPYSPMEALAHGTPLVVPNYRGLPEMVEGGAGAVANCDDVESFVDAVRRLLDPEEWVAASANARARYEKHFSATAQAPRLRRVYDRALGSGHPRSRTYR
ncbi:glycosyltransferase family 4 protein [Ornithinimicrobium cerasi]|nr:glycosyltransferase family 4 protein [Ornithinimicrobium cerasi]